MQFGKFVGYNQDPEWSKFFINYRTLGKALKTIEKHQKALEVRKRASDGLEEDKTKDIFHILLEAELNKVNRFYVQELKLLSRYFALLTEQIVQEGVSDEESDEAKDLRHQCCGPSATEIPAMNKTHFINFYAKCDALNNFASVNYKSLKTLLGKYDAKLGKTIKKAYLEKVKEMPFQKSKKLQQLMKDVEHLYAETFTNGNLHKAFKQLRPSSIGYSSLFSGGLMVGMTIPMLLCTLLLFFMYEPIIGQTPDFLHAVPVFRATGLPLIFVWCWSLLIIAWQKTTINYVYIMQLDTSTIASYLSVAKIAAIFSLVWFVGFICFVTSIRGVGTLPLSVNLLTTSSAFPMAVVACYLLLIFCPFNVFWRETRVGFLYTIVQIIISPFGRLQFRDFFVADYLTSMPKSLVDIAYAGCYVGTLSFLPDRTLNGYQTCKTTNNYYLATIIPILPFWWRFAQCLNKYYYTRKAFPHLVNAGKYFTGILFLLLAAVRVMASWDPFFILIFVLHFVNSAYSLGWDYVMDWGLCQRDSKFLFLRSELLLRGHWKYYATMIIDFVLRFIWIVEVFVTGILHPAYSNVLFAVLEILRRSLWAFFRVELEALQNWEEYRTIDFVPRLKPVFSSGKADKEAPTHDKRAFMVQKVSSYDIPLESTLNSDSLGEDLGRIDSGEMSSDWDRFRLEEKPFATKFSFRDSPASKRSPLPESHRGESTPQFSDDETATHRTKSPVSQPRDISFTQPKGLTELQVGSVRNTDMDRNKSRGKKSKKRNSK